MATIKCTSKDTETCMFLIVNIYIYFSLITTFYSISCLWKISRQQKYLIIHLCSFSFVFLTNFQTFTFSFSLTSFPFCFNIFLFSLIRGGKFKHPFSRKFTKLSLITNKNYFFGKMFNLLKSLGEDGADFTYTHI